MRQIKFRVWNTKKEKFDDDHGAFDTENIRINELIEFYEERGFILQQFTGLLDKNGKEIYEGDIGKSIDDVLWEVKYDTVLARFIGLYDGNVIEDLSEVHDSMEIIGNIYENPELLSSNK